MTRSEARALAHCTDLPVAIQREIKRRLQPRRGSPARNARKRVKRESRRERMAEIRKIVAALQFWARHLVSSERERGEGLAEALEGLLSHLGPGGYIPGAGEPATRRAQAALSAWRGGGKPWVKRR